MELGIERGKAPREKGVELARPIVIVGREEGVVGVTASERGRARSEGEGGGAGVAHSECWPRSGGWRWGGRRLLTSWRCGIKSGPGESGVWLKAGLGSSSSELSSKTALTAQVVAGRVGGITVVGCLRLRPLP